MPRPIVAPRDKQMLALDARFCVVETALRGVTRITINDSIRD
jgi:hypothetical protein